MDKLFIEEKITELKNNIEHVSKTAEDKLSKVVDEQRSSLEKFNTEIVSALSNMIQEIERKAKSSNNEHAVREYLSITGDKLNQAIEQTIHRIGEFKEKEVVEEVVPETTEDTCACYEHHQENTECECQCHHSEEVTTEVTEGTCDCNKECECYQHHSEENCDCDCHQEDACECYEHHVEEAECKCACHHNEEVKETLEETCNYEEEQTEELFVLEPNAEPEFVGNVEDGLDVEETDIFDLKKMVKDMYDNDYAEIEHIIKETKIATALINKNVEEGLNLQILKNDPNKAREVVVLIFEKALEHLKKQIGK